MPALILRRSASSPVPTLPTSWPSGFHNKCNKPKCAFPNEPQCVEGSFECKGSSKSGRRCTGVFLVSPRQAQAVSDWPSPLHHKCSDPDCTKPNQPQCVEGTFKCKGFLQSRVPCSGVFVVSTKQAAAISKSINDERLLTQKKQAERDAYLRRAARAARQTEMDGLARRTSRRGAEVDWSIRPGQSAIPPPVPPQHLKPTIARRHVEVYRPNSPPFASAFSNVPLTQQLKASGMRRATDAGRPSSPPPTSPLPKLPATHLKPLSLKPTAPLIPGRRPKRGENYLSTQSTPSPHSTSIITPLTPLRRKPSVYPAEPVAQSKSLGFFTRWR